MAVLAEIVFDCAHPASLARFWAAALDGYEVRPYDEAEIERLAALGLSPDTDPTVLVEGPGARMCFQESDAPKGMKNRVHLDLEVPDRRSEVGRLSTLGASVLSESTRGTTMLDPEGNEF